jgi:hypothetical protein
VEGDFAKESGHRDSTVLEKYVHRALLKSFMLCPGKCTTAIRVTAGEMQLKTLPVTV